jgi:hypothetical protein
MRTIYVPIYTLRPIKRGIRANLGKYHGFINTKHGISPTLLPVSLLLSMTTAHKGELTITKSKN